MKWNDDNFYDSMNTNIYTQQFGGSFDPYSGYRFQYPSRNLRGNGIWSTIKGGIWPILKKLLPYIGDVAGSAASGILTDMKDGSSFKDAGKKQVKRTVKKVALDVANKMDQSGNGRRKRKLAYQKPRLIKMKRKRPKPKTIRRSKRGKRVTRFNLA